MRLKAANTTQSEDKMNTYRPCLDQPETAEYRFGHRDNPPVPNGYRSVQLTTNDEMAIRRTLKNGVLPSRSVSFVEFFLVSPVLVYLAIGHGLGMAQFVILMVNTTGVGLKNYMTHHECSNLPG